MARITIEDCTDDITNRFELVLLSAYRTKELSVGAYTSIRKENDKNTVLALREIAKKVLNLQTIKVKLISNMQNNEMGKIDTEECNEKSDVEEAILEDFHTLETPNFYNTEELEETQGFEDKTLEESI